MARIPCFIYLKVKAKLSFKCPLQENQHRSSHFLLHIQVPNNILRVTYGLKRNLFNFEIISIKSEEGTQRP